MTRTTTPLPHEFRSAAVGTYDRSRLPIDTIVIHTMAGTLDGSTAWFQNPNRTSMSSAHYGIGFSGRIIQWVDENLTAYHAGNYSVNQSSIGIEHEDLGHPDLSRPDALYTSSAQLVADLCNFYKLPIDRQHIKKHCEVSLKPTACPDALDIERIVNMAAQIAGAEPVKNYEMPESQFIALVTGSSNMDEVLKAFNSLVPDEQKLQATNPKAGERVGEYIKYYLTAYKEMGDKIAKLEAVATQPTPQADPQTEPTPVAQIPVTPPSNPPVSVSLDKSQYEQAKLWVVSDLVGLISRFLAYLRGQ